MPDAIANLLQIMRDDSASPRDRINAAVSASRVQKLQLPGEEPPESVAYLRSLLDDIDVATNLRREAAAAVAYFERRSAKAALNFEVADASEQQRQWVTVINACIRYELTTRPGSNRSWPEDRELLRQGDVPTPATATEPTVAAILLPVSRLAGRRRTKHIDDPGGMPIFASERERKAAIQPAARACAECR